jgi:peptidoglycan/xylan/chitin deacetylase (PgdA/CDA1 family)
MQSSEPIKKGQIEDYIADAVAEALALKLNLGAYTGGDAKDLENQIIAAVTGVKGETLTPSSAAIGGTGVASFIVIEAGTYTNNGGFELPVGNIGVIARNASDVLSFAKTTLPLADYAKIVDVVLKNDLVTETFNLGNNIINPSLLQQNTSVGSNGLSQTESGSRSIIGQPVNGGVIHTFSGIPVDSNKKIAFINSSNVRTGGDFRMDTNPKTMTAPSDAVTVNFCISRFSEALPTQYKLEEGNTSTPYVAPKVFINSIDGKVLVAEKLTSNNITPNPISDDSAINKRYLDANFQDKAGLGIQVIPVGTNFIPLLANTTMTDTNIWLQDVFLNSSGALQSSAGWYVTNQFQEVYPGTYESNISFSGNARIITYNNFFEIEQIISPISGSTYNLQFSADVVYWKFSLLGNSNGIFLNSKVLDDIVGDSVFLTPKGGSEVAQNQLDLFGISSIPVGTNAILELVSSSLENTDLWDKGFLNSTGGLSSTTTTWRTSKKFYEIYSGNYLVKMYFSGNAKLIIFDKDYQILVVVNNGTSTYTATLAVPANGKFIKFAHDGATTTDTSLLKFSSTVANYPANTSVQTSNLVRESNTTAAVNGSAIVNFQKGMYRSLNTPKSRQPIVSFISDDGHIANDAWYIPVLDSKKIKSSFVIITSRMDVLSDYYTRARVRELHDLGHDIGGHTHSHINLTTLTASEVEIDLQKGKRLLLELGINVETFVSPFGGRTTDIDKVVRKYYENNSITGADSTITDGTCGNNSPISSYGLSRISFDTSANNTLRLETCKSAVDVALANNRLLIFAIHPHFTEYQSGNALYVERRQELSDLIDYIKSKDISIMPLKQAMEIWKNPVELGNLGLDSKYWELGMDGTERGNYFE